jgi:hypothetical protein
MPKSIGPAARLNNKSVGTPNSGVFALAVSECFLLRGDDMGKTKNSKEFE